MLKMVDGTGIIGVDMICPLGVSTPQPPNYDRVELEGTGILVLPNSLNALLERLELGGKTDQVQTSGKNLFNIKTYRDMNGCEIINNNQLSFVQNLAKINYEIELDAGDYRISFNRKKYSSITIRNGETVLNTNGGEIDYGYTIKLSEPAVISIEFASGQNPNAEQRIIYNIQLEKSSTTTPYEPYTGGKPSPSQEYQQEVKNAGKWNEEKQKYEVDVKVFAGNLFDGSNSKKGFFTGEFGGQISLITSQGYSWESKIDTLSGVKVTLSVQSNVNTRFRIYATDINGMILYKYEDSSANQADNYHTFVIPDKTENLLVSVLEISDSKDAKIILNVGENRLPNAIYKAPQSLTLTSDRPLTKWDRLVEQGGQIGWLYKSAVVKNFNGDGYKIQSAGNIGNVNKYSIVFPDALIKGNATADIYVDRYRGINASYAKEEYGICCNWNDGIKYFNAPNETVKTVDDFKKWLTENPLTIAYETESTEFVPLPEEEQNAIRALKTYYPTTVITADGGELYPDIKVTYRKEI